MQNKAYELEKKIRKIQPDAGPTVEHHHTRTVYTRTTGSSHSAQQQHQHSTGTNATPRSHSQQSTQQNQQGTQNNTPRPADSQSQSPVQNGNQDDSSRKNTQEDATKKNGASNSGTSNNSNAINSTDASWSTGTKVGVAGLAMAGVVAIAKFLPTIINKCKECWYNDDNNKKVVSHAQASIADDGIDEVGDKSVE